MPINVAPTAGFMSRNPQARTKSPGLGPGQRAKLGAPGGLRRPPPIYQPPIREGGGPVRGGGPMPPEGTIPGYRPPAPGLEKTMPMPNPIGGGLERTMPMPGRIPGYTPPPMGGGKLPIYGMGNFQPGMPGGGMAPPPPPMMAQPPDGLNRTMPIDVGGGGLMQKIGLPGTGAGGPGDYHTMGNPMPQGAEIPNLRRYFMG